MTGETGLSLTPAERRIFNLLVETPDTYKMMARAEGRSIKTIGTQAEAVFRKLGYSHLKGRENRRIALILAHHEAVVRGLDRSSLRSVECSCHLTKSGGHPTPKAQLDAPAEPREWR